MSVSRPATSDSPLAIRVQRMRVARGACWVIALALVSGTLLTLVDAATWLSAWMRGLCLAGWLTAVGVLGWCLIFSRLQAPRAADPAHSAEREVGENVRAAAGASMVLLSCLLAAVLVPNATVHIRRVALPWYRPAGLWRVVVTSKDPVIPRGEPVILTAYVEPMEAAGPPPKEAVLVCRNRDGEDERISMTGDGAGVFYAEYRAASSGFQYRVEAAGSTSEWHIVTAIELAIPTGHSTIEVIPPDYAADAILTQRHIGYVSFSGFQYSRVELTLHFSRPATAAWLLWRTEASSTEEPVVLDLAANHLSARVSLRLKQSGTLRLITSAEEHGKTLTSLPDRFRIDVIVIPHLPPRFVGLDGVAAVPLRIRPGDKVPIELEAADAIRVGEASLEYALADAVARSVSIPLSRPKPNTAVGHFDWDLPGKLPEGQRVRYRLRVSDTRVLVDPKLTPQEVFFPEGEWARLVVDRTAPPLATQKIEADRDTISTELAASTGEIEQVLAGLRSLPSEGQLALELHHQGLIQSTQTRCGAIGRSLEHIADRAGLTPDLRPLAGEIRKATEPVLRAGNEELTRALTDDSSARTAAVAAAIKQLALAEEQIERLKARNLRLAHARIDAYQLQALLAEERVLAERLSAGTASVEEVRRAQADLQSRLIMALAEAEPLRAALVQADRRLILACSEKLLELAAAIQKLNGEIEELDAEVRKEVLKELSAEASAAADRVAALLDRIEQAARLASLPLPKPAEFRRVRDLIDAGKMVESLTELQRLANVLTGIAGPFEKAAADRIDVRITARQYTAWLEDLRARVEAAAGGWPNLPPAIRQAFRDELTAAQSSVAALQLPPSADAIGLRGEASMHLMQAGVSLADTGASALAEMKAAAAALTKLADKLPSVGDRLAKTRSVFDGIRQEQDAIRSGIGPVGPVDPNKPDLSQTLKTYAARQKKQRAAVLALDLPGLDARRDRTLAAVAAAAADLEAGLPYDIMASQEWVKRELERLRFVLADRSFSPTDPSEEESDLQRVQRLAWSRRTAAGAAVKLRGTNVNRAASEKAHDELVREAEELMGTRVGQAGKEPKHRAVELYNKLKNMPEPDHDPRIQKDLSVTLDELAGMMADVGEFARPPDRTPPAAPTAADRYLPSVALAAELRTVAVEYRKARDRLTRLAAEVNQRTHDVRGKNAYFERQTKLEARGLELSALAARGADGLRLAAADRHPEDRVRTVLTDAARDVDTASKQLGEAAQHSFAGARAEALEKRVEARSMVSNWATRIAMAVPAATEVEPRLVAAAEPILRAQKWMRRAEERLGAKPDIKSAAAAMRSAADALAEAIAKRIAAAD